MILIKEFNIEHETDSGVIVRKTITLAKLVGLPNSKQVALGTTVSEMIRLILRNKSKGSIRFFINEEKNQELVVEINEENSAKSIQQLSANNSTFDKLKQLVDHMEWGIDPESEQALIKIQQALPQRIIVSPDLIVEWLNKLKAGNDNYFDLLKENNTELHTAYSEIQKKQNSLLEAHEQLEKRNQEILAKNQEIEDFTSIVAHDLKSPLDNIFNILQILKSQNEDPSKKKFFEIADAQITRMQNFIGTVLDFTKAGSEAIEPETIDLNKFVPEIIEYLGVEQKATVSIGENLPSISYTKGELQIIIQNLVTNAVKYNDKENPSLEIFCTETATETTFHVKDNGIGLSEENQKKLFRFGKMLSDMAAENSTGVGLALIKKIIEKHGGEINVKSKEGEGSTFFFTIPK